MRVHVRLFGQLRDRFPAEQKGKGVLELESDALVQDVLDALRIDDYVVIAVNDEQDSSRDTRLSEDDNVMIFEMAAGG